MSYDSLLFHRHNGLWGLLYMLWLLLVRRLDNIYTGKDKILFCKYKEINKYFFQVIKIKVAHLNIYRVRH